MFVNLFVALGYITSQVRDGNKVLGHFLLIAFKFLLAFLKFLFEIANRLIALLNLL